MKVWIALRQDTYHKQEGCNPPIDDTKVMIVNVFDCLEKAKAYVEQMIAQDKQTYFGQQYRKPIVTCYESWDMGVNYDLFADNYGPGHSSYYYYEIAWKIREKEVQ